MTNKLSNTDARTIRHTTDAIELVMSGAIRHLESDYGPEDMADRNFAIDSLILHMREQLMGGFMTSHEMGNSEIELTNEQTSLDMRPEFGNLSGPHD